MKKSNIIIGSIVAIILIIAISFAVFNVALPDGVKDSSYLLTAKVTKMTYQDKSFNFMETSDKKPSGYIDVTSKAPTIAELEDKGNSVSYWTNATDSKCSLTYGVIKENLKSSRAECYANMKDFKNEYVDPETDEAGIFKSLTYISWAVAPIPTKIITFFWTIFFDENELEDIRTCFWLLEDDRFFSSASQCEDFASGEDVGTKPTSDTGDYTIYSKAECVDLFASEPAKFLECNREAKGVDGQDGVDGLNGTDGKNGTKVICSQAGQTGCIKPPVIVTGFTCDDLSCVEGEVCQLNNKTSSPECVVKELNEGNTFNLIWILVAFVVLLLIIVGFFALNPAKRSKGRPRKLFVKRRRR